MLAVCANAQITISNAVLSGTTSGSALLSGTNTFTGTNTFSALARFPNMDTPTNSPTDAYILTAAGTGGSTKWAAASAGAASNVIDVAASDTSISIVTNSLLRTLAVGSGATNAWQTYANGVTNGYGWTNLTVAHAGAVTNGFGWTNLTVAHASAVTNGYSWTNIPASSVSSDVTNAWQTYAQSVTNGYPWGVSAATFPPLSNTVFVSPLGNDTTGVRGRLDLPCLTITNAVQLAKAGDTIYVFNGYYDGGTICLTNVTLKGESEEGVVIRSGSTVILARYDFNVENVTIIGTNDNHPIWVYPVVPGTNSTIRHVKFLGSQDNLVVQNSVCISNLLVEDCVFNSWYDCMNLQGGTVNTNTYTFRNCKFHAYKAGTSNVQRCVAAVRGLLSFENCDFIANDGSSATYCFDLDTPGPDVRVSNCGMSATSTNGGSVTKVRLVAGSVTFDGCAISTNNITQTGGTVTITSGTYIGQFAGDGTGLSNIVATTASSFTGQLSPTNYNNGTAASITTWLRGDGTWVAPSGSGDAVLANNQNWTGSNNFAGPLTQNGVAVLTNVTSAAAATIATNLTGAGSITITNGTRILVHDSTHTLITNTATLTSSEWTAGSQKEWYNGTATITIDKTNGLINLNTLSAATSITNGGLTAFRLVLSDANKALVSAAGSGAVPVNADGSASTFAQVQALSGDKIVTNNYAAALTLVGPVTVSGIVQAQTFDNPTNTWAVNTAIGLGTNAVYVNSGTATLGITGIANGPTTTERYGQLTIINSGALTFTNWTSLHVSDHALTRTVPATTNLVITVDVIPGQCTNIAIGQF